MSLIRWSADLRHSKWTGFLLSVIVPRSSPMLNQKVILLAPLFENLPYINAGPRCPKKDTSEGESISVSFSSIAVMFSQI
jgi:hypothetical protein